MTAVSCQQYQQQGANYVDEYSDYESPRPAHPTPRSYSPAAAPAQRQSTASSPKPTPVAILKQINRHHEDGSYTYGFEGADGSFKIETKLPTGEVKGKYGFVDDTGKVRVVEYGANQYGFQPAGEGITVAPPTLVDETTSKEALQNYQDYDYQQPAARPAPQRAAARPAPVIAPRQQPAYQQPTYQQPQYEAPAQPVQSHTQAFYNPQSRARASVPKPPVFTPAAQPSLPQSHVQSFASQPQDAYSAPRPAARQRPVYEEPSPVAQQQNQGPVQFNPISAPSQPQRSHQPQARSQSGGILDQLARDYALPQGGAAPLHDISFGYY
ncbi:uncharacterized protein LOC107265046 isoform X2 [Cephus cinctus]|nr:uncharacterized protein LOC107265046 isoform X2 [Cephus cinctus]